MPRRFWTPQEIEKLQQLYPETPSSAIAQIFNRSVSQIYGKAQALGLKKSERFLASKHSGRLRGERGKGTRFQKGNVPWSAGKKLGTKGRSGETQFKPGQLPHNTKEDGAISIRSDKQGRKYKWIRIELGKWVHLHRHIWEEANGPIPTGHCVVFKDRNSLNCQLDNLELITRKENVRRNTIHRYPEEIKKAIRLTSKLKKAIKNHE